ncbi:hypothetical protein [Nocardiopsis metallicus]|uniref:Uncharacterized protein n=1 Tax=Nocardiopsis metallicus TaxID=179819 RepID=A0A840WFQ6_9ACTN|nr:hypothetical protein [Nocardiopsis metallicus]MBB5495799.1 hypothetical protein [Nocardiopsis metallicus]
MDTIYLVENSTGGYWAKAYQSVAKAKAGVEYWTAKKQIRVRWQPEGFATIAVDAATGERLHTIVGLPVHRDQDAEES